MVDSNAYFHALTVTRNAFNYSAYMNYYVFFPNKKKIKKSHTPFYAFHFINVHK